MQTFIDYGPRVVDVPAAAGMLIRPIEALCGRRLEPGVRVLEVGCGNGFFAGWFASFGCSVVGIDAAAAQVGVARRSYPRARFEQDQIDGRLLERLGEDPFDLVVSTGTIAQSQDHRAFLRGCFRALRQGGRLVCTTPFDGHLRDAPRPWGAPAPAVSLDGRLRAWTRRALTAVLIDTGFRNVQFRGAGRLPLLWKSIVVSADRPLEQLVTYGAPGDLTA